MLCLHVNTMRLNNLQIRDKIKLLDSLIDTYNENRVHPKRDLKKYENTYERRLHKAIFFFQKFIPQAINSINFSNKSKMGRPEKLNLEQRVKILLIQRLVDRSNREMSNMLLLFSFLTNVDISYKTVERLYDDSRIQLVLINMNSLINKELNLTESDCCGDATGYVLSVKEHYATSAQKLKNKGKTNTKKRKVLFSFTLLDVNKRIYLAFGTSYKSEKDAYNKAMEMLKKMNIRLKSVRLDRYYSGQSTVKNMSKMFQGIKCYLIPKKNVTIRGSLQWKQMLFDFCNHTTEYFEEYFKRNQSESGFSEDKRRFGWKIPQKLPARVNLAYNSIFTWHNLMWVGQ